MPMEFMLELSEGDLPRTVEGARAIDCLRVLVAANLVQAVLPEVDASLQTGEVQAITAEGRAALRKAYPDREFRFQAGSAAGVPTRASLFPRWPLTREERPGAAPRRDASDSQI